MKARFMHGAALWTFLFAATLTTSCSDDDNDYKDVDGKNPVVKLTSDHIRTLTGYEFKIAGKVSDKDGIRSIQLKCADLNLDKTIDLLSIYDEPLYEYGLNYSFTIPEKTSGESFIVKVIVTDLGGRLVENEVSITMDGDYTKPVITPSTGLLSTEINIVLSEGTSRTFKFKASDKEANDKGLGRLELSIPELNILESIDIEEEGVTEQELTCTVTFPSDKTGTYPMVIRAIDWLGNVAEKEYTVLVSKVKDYTNLYLVDFEGTTNTLLTVNDVWGIPMPIERIANFSYKARYYSSQPNTPIRFITSKTSFNICFGDDKNNPGKLTGVSEDVQPIILPEKGYYEITLNTEESEYSIKKYTPEDEPITENTMIYLDDSRPNEGQIRLELGLAGEGFTGAGWDTTNLLMLNQDTDNPYIFTCDMEVAKRGSVKITITPRHSWGWWPSPFWRFDGANERFAPGDEIPDNIAKTIAAGSYTFVFDTHLCQSKLLKK